MPKRIKTFRFNPQPYESFKELASKNGYTMTSAFEKFMSSALENGLVFPSAPKIENIEAEARVMLAWLKDGKYWVNLGGKAETSIRGRLLQLLPTFEDADLRLDIEETLKKKPYYGKTFLILASFLTVGNLFIISLVSRIQILRFYYGFPLSRVLFLLTQFMTGISRFFSPCGKASLSSLCRPKRMATLPFPVRGT
jgi:hypothetical protein